MPTNSSTTLTALYLKAFRALLSLAIIDHDMDGETRSVASLWGRVFPDCPTLSLAIANMASGSMKNRISIY